MQVSDYLTMWDDLPNAGMLVMAYLPKIIVFACGLRLISIAAHSFQRG